MKKRVLVLLAVCVFALTGCSAATKQEGSEQEVAKQEDATTSEVTSEMNADEEDAATEEQAVTEEQATTEESAISIADEMAQIEKKSLEFENADWDIPQSDMNFKSNDWYVLWDDELNSLWERVLACVPEDKKENLTINQTEWVKRKEQNVIAAGFAAYGGSLQPLLENTIAKDMTRKQAYYLASCLGELTGEGYSIPEDVEQSYSSVDVNIGSVFESFAGTYSIGDGIELNVKSLDDSDFMAEDFPEGTYWLTWYSHSAVLCESDVYAFSNDIIIFKKESVYYVLHKTVEGDGVEMSVGEDLGSVDIVGSTN